MKTNNSIYFYKTNKKNQTQKKIKLLGKISKLYWAG